MATAAVYVAVAYACWNLRRWSFIAAIIIALFSTLGGLAFSFSFGTTSVFRALSESAYLVVRQLIFIFHSFRAYREQETVSDRVDSDRPAEIGGVVSVVVIATMASATEGRRNGRSVEASWEAAAKRPWRRLPEVLTFKHFGDNSSSVAF